MLAVFRKTIHISRLSGLPVLLTGVTGTGKGLLARATSRTDPGPGVGGAKLLPRRHGGAVTGS